MKRISKTALAGILCALAVVIMVVGSLFAKIDIATAVFSSVCIMLILNEAGYKYAIGAYLAVSIISFLIVPSKTPVALFLAFFGYYPILKQYTEQRFRRPVAYVLKYIVLNMAIAVLFVIANTMFAKIPLPVITIVFIGANLVLPIFDIALGIMMSFYYSRIRK